jgi:hypothetical protein
MKLESHDRARTESRTGMERHCIKNAGAFDRYYLMSTSDFKSSLKREIEKEIAKLIELRRLSMNSTFTRLYNIQIEAHEKFLELLNTVEP